MLLLAHAEAFALFAHVVSEQCAEYEIFLRRQPVQRFCDEQPYGVYALFASEVDVYGVLSRFLLEIADVLAFQSFYGHRQVIFVQCA